MVNAHRHIKNEPAYCSKQVSILLVESLAALQLLSLRKYCDADVWIIKHA